MISMSSVIENYKTAYEEQHHVVDKIQVGLPIEHNTRSTNYVCWRCLELDLEVHSWLEVRLDFYHVYQQIPKRVAILLGASVRTIAVLDPKCCEAIDAFAGKGKRLWNLWIRSGKREDPWQLHVRQTKKLLASRKLSPLKAKCLNSERNSSLQTRSSDLTIVEIVGSRNVNCRFNIQPPSSRESARIALSLEPGEVPYLPKSAKDANKGSRLVLQKELCFNRINMAVRSQSSHGFTKLRRSKKFFKIGSAQSEDAVIRSVKSIKGTIRFLPRVAHNQSVEPPVMSRCLLGTKYLDGTPGFDDPKACWECLRTVYRTKNDATLLMLKDKLANLRMQGPQAGDAFLAVEEIFQQLVGIGEAITTKLNAFERTIATLTENCDVVVQSVNSQNDLQALKQLAKQLVEESPIDTDTPIPVKKKRGPVYEKYLAAKQIISSSLRKMGFDTEPHVHYRVPPCNWCGLHGHRMRDIEALEKEIARRVREYKNQIGPTLPNSSREEPRENQQSEAETAMSSLEVPSGKLVLWHKNRFREPLVQEQSTGECGSPRQNVCTEPVAGDGMDHSLVEVDVDQLTTPTERSTDTTTSRKEKMSLVQRRLRTKFMYLLGLNKSSPQVKNHVSRRKTVHKKKRCKDLQF